jgi:hypothetical protein
LVFPWGVATLDPNDPFFHPYHGALEHYPKGEAYHKLQLIIGCVSTLAIILHRATSGNDDQLVLPVASVSRCELSSSLAFQLHLVQMAVD